MEIDTDIIWDKRYYDILNRSNGKVFKKGNKIKEYRSLYNIDTNDDKKLDSVLNLPGIVKNNRSKVEVKVERSIEELDPVNKYFKSNSYSFSISELLGSYDIKDGVIDVEIIEQSENSTYEIENDYLKIYTPNGGSILLKLICSSNTVIVTRNFGYYNTKEIDM